jgi:hypothetical protein
MQQSHLEQESSAEDVQFTACYTAGGLLSISSLQQMAINEPPCADYTTATERWTAPPYSHQLTRQRGRSADRAAVNAWKCTGHMTAVRTSLAFTSTAMPDCPLRRAAPRLRTFRPDHAGTFVPDAVCTATLVDTLALVCGRSSPRLVQASDAHMPLQVMANVRIHTARTSLPANLLSCAAPNPQMPSP